MNCKIVIPSYSRADSVLTKNICRDVILCVPESQKEEYKLYNPDVEIVTHPDSVKGLPPKRNWMVRHFGELFMLDDDIAYVRRLNVAKGETARIKDKEEVFNIIQRLYGWAKLLDISLFGFGNMNTPVMYNPFEPIRLTNRITGCSYGVIQSENTFWNEDLVVKEDFWISSYVLYKERKILVDTRYKFDQKDTFKNPGGLSSYRNGKTEMESILQIKKYFGDSIILKKSTYRVNKGLKYNISSKYKI